MDALHPRAYWREVGGVAPGVGDCHHQSQRALVLPTGGPASDRLSWRAKPSLPPDFDSVLSKIRSLAESGLTSLHVLGDFLKRQIAPLKQRPRPTWSFTGPQDCSRTHRGEDSDLTQEGDLRQEIRAGGDGGDLRPGAPDPPSGRCSPLRGLEP